jgi:hypothetical protein
MIFFIGVIYSFARERVELRLCNEQQKGSRATSLALRLSYRRFGSLARVGEEEAGSID